MGKPKYADVVSALGVALDVAGAELELDRCLSHYGEPCKARGTGEELCSVCSLQEQMQQAATVYEAATAKPARRRAGARIEEERT